MKYEFIKKDIDTTILRYKENEYEIKSTIGIVSKIQSYLKRARLTMIKDLAKEGMTVEDLVIVKKENGKTYRDETNKNEYEKIYTENAINEVVDEVCMECFNKKLADLVVDIGIEDEEESAKFGTELMNILLGQIPSGKQTE